MFTCGMRTIPRSPNSVTWELLTLRPQSHGQSKDLCFLLVQTVEKFKSGMLIKWKESEYSMDIQTESGPLPGIRQYWALDQEIRQFFIEISELTLHSRPSLLVINNKYVVSNGLSMTSNYVPVVMTTNFWYGIHTQTNLFWNSMITLQLLRQWLGLHINMASWLQEEEQRMGPSGSGIP